MDSSIQHSSSIVDVDTVSTSVDNDNIIYRKEKLLRRVLIIGIVVPVVYVVVLFVIGFIMGLSDTNPPTFDPQVVSNQVEKIRHGHVSTTFQDELTKVS